MRAVSLSLLLIAVSAPLAAQNVAGWQLAGTVSTIRIGDSNGWGRGPGLRIDRSSTGPIGMTAAVRALVTSTGFYEFEGAAADLGIGLALVRAPVDVRAIAGGAFLIGGDSDGTPGYLGGPWGGLRLGVPIAGRIGIVATGWGGFWVRSGEILSSAAFDGGLTFRF